MRHLIFDVTLDPDGRYVAEAQGEDIFTDAADWEELKHNVREVVSAFYFDSVNRQRSVCTWFGMRSSQSQEVAARCQQ